MNLRICEIFHSIQGEGSFVGQPCVFVRLSGCNLRCEWCDTTYAYTEIHEMSVDEVLSRVESYPCNLVEITGGEPMIQEEAVCLLMNRLLDNHKQVLLETNGSLNLDNVPQSVHRIIDLKPPASRIHHDEVLWMHYAQNWRPTDEIKCVVADRNDFDWCIHQLKKYHALNQIIHFSPVWGRIEARALAEWICQSGLPIRLNIQIQKIIWDPSTRGV